MHRLLRLLLLAPAFLAADPAPPVGVPLLPRAPDAPPALRYYGAGRAVDLLQPVAVTGQDFSKALRIDTFARTEPRKDFGLEARIDRPVKKGDVLWISFKARSLRSSRESGESLFELRFERLVNGKHAWPPHLERGISIGSEWTETSIPFVAREDADADTSRLVIRFDSYAQNFELGPITFLAHGPDVPLSALPRSVVRYGGDEPDAPWRAAAAERIERLRKGDLAVRVVGPDGTPVADAEVAVNMRRIAFDFGTAVTSERILNQKDPDAQKYREILESHFNQVVFENEMKWNRWAAPNHSPEPTLRALDWLDARGIRARGHVLVWPSWRHTPAFLRDLKDDPAALREAIFKNIALQTKIMRGRFQQWDVTNELTNHHDVLDILGWDELAAWYRAAHAGEPDAKLFYNEYTMFFADPGWRHFYDTVASLKAAGAPLHGIGEQAHIGGTPPAIPLVLERLDHFGALGYPIIVTEFDINSNDEDFQARYLRDFLTAFFSHPATTGFVQWGFWEGAHWFPTAALWNRDWTLRKHGEAYIELVNKTWRTDYAGRTSADGTTGTRAFYGDYDITVTHAGRTHTTRVKHAPGATVHPIALP